MFITHILRKPYISLQNCDANARPNRLNFFLPISSHATILLGKFKCYATFYTTSTTFHATKYDFGVSRVADLASFRARVSGI